MRLLPGSLVLLALAVPVFAVDAPLPRTPNIIFILTDDKDKTPRPQCEILE